MLTLQHVGLAAPPGAVAVLACAHHNGIAPTALPNPHRSAATQARERAMSVTLTYHVRSGVIAGLALGLRVNVRVQTGTDLGSWAKVNGLDVTWEVVEYSAGGQRTVGTQLLQKPSGLPTPRDAASCAHCRALKSVAFVDDGGVGFLIHGWPPCTGRRCVAVTSNWEVLLNALLRERSGSLRIAY